MYHYRLFGGTLSSDLEFPELQSVAERTPSWTLTSREGAFAGAEGELLGTDAVTGDVCVHLYRTARGLRMVFDDTGSFDITDAGRTIAWTHGRDVVHADARTDITSRVIAAALHDAGTICLHASAVVTGDEAVAFVAPKFHGKSTTALSLVHAGAKLLTDDTLPVTDGDVALACPGLHATRLWADSAARVAIGSAHDTASGEKQLFSSLPEEHITHDTAPLGALYLLAPTREPRDGGFAWRTRLTAPEATMVMIGHAKLAPLLTKSEAPRLFRTAAALAARVPVYRLNVVRDLERIEETAALIMSWHTRSAAGASA